MDYVTMLREYRIGPFTIFDTVLAYLGILIISPLLIKLFSLVHLKITLASWLWLTMPLSVIFHLVFSQNCRCRPLGGKILEEIQKRKLI